MKIGKEDRVWKRYLLYMLTFGVRKVAKQRRKSEEYSMQYWDRMKRFRGVSPEVLKLI